MQFGLNNERKAFCTIKFDKRSGTKDDKAAMRFYSENRNDIENLFVTFKPVRSADDVYKRVERSYTDRFKGRTDKHKADEYKAHAHLFGSKDRKYFQKRFHRLSVICRGCFYCIRFPSKPIWKYILKLGFCQSYVLRSSGIYCFVFENRSGFNQMKNNAVFIIKILKRFAPCFRKK